MSEPEYDVFISFNSSDRQWAARLAAELRQRRFGGRHFRVFFSEDAVPPGGAIPQASFKAVAASQHFVPIVSPGWLRSEWCQGELSAALMSDPSGSKHRVIPVLLKDWDASPSIGHLRFVDFRDPSLFGNSLEELVRELRNHGLIADMQTRQRKLVLNQSILPWTAQSSPSVDFIWPELYIEPRVSPHKHPQSATHIRDWLKGYDWNGNVLLTGAPGIGKSTALRALFLRLTDANRAGFPGQQIPVWATASDVLEWRRQSHRSLLAGLDHLVGYRVPRQAIASRGLILLVDGLDEVGDAGGEAVAETLSRHLPDKTTFWVASRTDFHARLVARKPEWGASFDEVLEILEWDEETDSLTFAKEFATRVGAPEAYVRLRELKDRLPEARPFLRNPFSLTLILYVLTGEGAEDESARRLQKDSLANSYALYGAFYANWVGRERQRGTANLDEETIVAAHRRVAEALFAARGSAVDLKTAIVGAVPEGVYPSLLRDTAFSGLLLMRSESRGRVAKVVRYRHETIGEFLVADALVEVFRNSDDLLAPLERSVDTVYTHEVNVFVRGAFECLPPGQSQKMLRGLEDVYVRLFSSRPELRSAVREALALNPSAKLELPPGSVEQSEEVFRLREQILYYVGRLPAPDAPRLIRFACVNESTALLRRVATISAMLHGDEEIEADFLAKLQPGSPDDLLNRTVQLVYYGDASADVHRWHDDGYCPWAKTRKSIYHRLRGISPRDLRLRWWDLRTLRLFYLSRGWRDPISADEAGVLKTAAVAGDGTSSRRSELLAAERSDLLDESARHRPDS